jgi:hypothetical protein
MSRQISTKHIINTIKIIYKAFENGNFSPSPKNINTSRLKSLQIAHLEQTSLFPS